MGKFAGCIVLTAVLATFGPFALAQTKPKTTPSAPEVQTQKPNAQPLQTQQLPAQVPQVQQPAGGSQQAAPGSPGEVFLMPVPKGWKQVSVEVHYNIRTVRYVPEGQTSEKAQEMLRSLVFSFVKDAPLENFLVQAIALPNGQCQDIFMAPIAKGMVNGYESVFTTRFCTKDRQSGQGEVTMFKLIQGKVGLYLGERTWRVKPFSKDTPPVPKDVFETWSAYMRAVTLCTPHDSLRPCPAGAAN